MDRIVLKSEIVDKIKSDPILIEKIANALDISKNSMPRLLYGNDSRLTQAGVVRILKSQLKIKHDRDLFSELKMVSV